MKIITHYLILVFVFLTSLTLGGCNHFTTKKRYEEYRFSNLSGSKLTITKIKNRLEIIQKNATFPNQKPVLFFFLYPSCTPCFEGIEHLKRLYDEYKNQTTIFPILLDSQNDIETLRNEAITINKSYQLDFDFYFANDTLDFVGTFERQSEGNLIVLYDQNLNFITQYEGLVPEEMIEFDINKLLKHGESNVQKP